MVENQIYGSSADPFASPYYGRAEKQRTSGCLKVVLITCLIGGIALVGCCIGGGFYIKNSFITDPGDLDQLSRELIDWEFNNELSTEFGLDTFIFQMVVKTDPDKGSIMMVQPGWFGGLQVGQQIENDQQREFQFGGETEIEKTVVLESEKRTIEVGAHSLNLEFNLTESVRTKQKYWEVIGVFPGKRGPVIALIQLRESAYSDVDIESRIRAIKLP